MRQLLLTNNTCYKRNVDKADSRYTTFQARGPKGIMMHSTGADNPTLKRYIGPDDGVLGTNIYGNHWNNPGLDVCVHAFIGETKDGTVECYQTLPWNFRGWHCGAEANDTHISIEICEDDLTSPAYFRATRSKALDVVSDLCLELGFDPLAKGVLIDHHEGAAMGIASNHGDVTHWWGRYHYSMSDFRRDVARRMQEKEKAMKKEIEDFIRKEINTAVGNIKIPAPDVSAAAQEAVSGELSIWGTQDKHSGWADDAIQWAVANKLVNGHEGGNFGWEKPITREEIVTIVHRLYQMIELMLKAQ